jgi:hypothetical protein
VVGYMFIVEHYQTLHSYLACQSEFSYRYPDFSVWNKLIIYIKSKFSGLCDIAVTLYNVTGNKNLWTAIN